MLAASLAFCCAAVAAGGCVYFVLLLVAVRSHVKGAWDRSAEAAPVPLRFSVLRPLHGDHPGLADNLRDGLDLGPLRHELLFAAADSADAGLQLARSLAEREARVRWMPIAAGNPSCPNAKVHSLRAMTEASDGEVLVILDSDVKAGPGLLGDLAREFRDPTVGVVTCPYRAVAGRSPWSRLEALGMNTEFWGGVLTARLIFPMDFAVGPAMAVRRSCLDAIGGWERVAEHLAEDFELGRLARAAGWSVRLASHVVEHRIGSSELRQNWAHRLRWRRSTKRSRPLAYWGEVFTNPLPWAAALAALMPGRPWAWALLAVCCVLRVLAAQGVSGRVLGDRLGLGRLAALPVQDALSALTWAAGLFGSTVVWAGRSYDLLPDGRLRAQRR